MTSLFGRTVTSSTCRLLKNFSRKCIRTTDHLKSTPRYSVSDITRSYWSMSSTINKNMGSFQVLPTNLCKKCAIRGIHTEGDTEFSNFLGQEIKAEKSSDQFSKPLPEIANWEVKTEDSNVTMTRKLQDEMVTVRFNIVDSVNAEDSYDFEETRGNTEGQEQIPNMVSKPPFTVEIKKPSGKILSLKCSFPLDEMPVDEAEEQGEAEGVEDVFEIDEVAVFENKQSESSYSVLSSTMDGTLYDMLMDMLDERGISNEFVNTMTEYSTGYEQRQYVTFLQNLKSFVDEK